MDTSFLNKLSEVSQIVTGASALMIAIGVYRRDKLKHQEDILREFWTVQREINLAAMSNPQALEALEFVINDVECSEPTEKQLRLSTYFCFLALNRIYPVYRGITSGMVRRKVGLAEIDATLGPYLTRRKLLEDVLDRGYSVEYQTFINERIGVVLATLRQIK